MLENPNHVKRYLSFFSPSLCRLVNACQIPSRFASSFAALREDVRLEYETEPAGGEEEARAQRRADLDTRAVAWTRSVEVFIRKREKRGLKHVPANELEAQILILERKPSPFRRPCSADRITEFEKLNKTNRRMLDVMRFRVSLAPCFLCAVC